MNSHNALLWVAAIAQLLAVNSSTVRADDQAVVVPQADSWIANAFLHAHHSSGSYGPEWDKQIDAVRPDVMQFHATSQQIASRLADRYGFRLCFTINQAGEYDYGTEGYSEAKGFFPRVDPLGKAYGREKIDHYARHLCFNSPAVDKELIPIYVAATRQYRPAQIWIDSTVITVNYCYCSVCREKFSEQFGHQPPLSADELLWPTWIKFHRKCFENWMERISQRVHEADPNSIVTFNHAYWPNQPETPPPFIENLSADIHSHSLFIGLYSRYATTIGLPFDIMIGLTDTWGGHHAKPERTLTEEVAAVISCGGSWNIGEFPASSDVQPEKEMLKIAAAGATFARDRRAWTFHTQSVPSVAVLTSATTHYARIPSPASRPAGEELAIEALYTDDGKIVQVAKDPQDSRIYWQQGRDAPPFLTGVYEALVENQIHFDIVNEDILARRIGEYELVIVPEQFALASNTIQAIRTYVAAGGKLLATGATIDAGLDDVLGVRKVTKHVRSDGAFEDLRTTVTRDVIYQIEPVTARTVDVPPAIASPPTLTINQFGQGAAGYLNTDLFSYYVDWSPYNIYHKRKELAESEAFLKYFAGVLSQLWLERRISVVAPRWFDVVLRENDAVLLIQMLNRAGAYHHSGETEQDIVIDVALDSTPKKVSMQPGGESIPWDWHDGRLKATVRSTQVPVHRILEIQLAGD